MEHIQWNGHTHTLIHSHGSSNPGQGKCDHSLNLQLLSPCYQLIRAYTTGQQQDENKMATTKQDGNYTELNTIYKQVRNEAGSQVKLQ